MEKSDVNDADLASRIDQILGVAGDSVVGVRVAVDNGAVHLSGRVPTQSARLAAVVRVRAVPGVRVVSEDLTILRDDGPDLAEQGG